LVQSITHVQSAQKKEKVEEEDINTGEKGVAGTTISAMRVLHKPGDKSFLPYFVSARYTKGGSSHYLTDDFGVRTSGVYLKMPLPQAYRTMIDVATLQPCCSKEKLSFLSVIGHDFGGDVGRGVRFRILWQDGLTSYEVIQDFIKTNWWQLYLYAARNNLLDKAGFGRLRPKKGFQRNQNKSTETYEGYLEIDLESTQDKEELRLAAYKAAMKKKP
jgi:hypothetical protein